MDLSLAALATVGFLVATRLLARLYLTRLDQKQETGTPRERSSIAASRDRAQGHLWVGGAILAGIVIFALLAGINRPDFGLDTALAVALLFAFGAVAVGAAIRSYRPARRPPDR
jgi:uncharacterized membrane protein